MTKVSKAHADYQDHPNGDERCDGCSMWRPPQSCTKVDGEDDGISPRGWCDYWYQSKRRRLVNGMMARVS